MSTMDFVVSMPKNHKCHSSIDNLESCVIQAVETLSDAGGVTIKKSIDFIQLFPKLRSKTIKDTFFAIRKAVRDGLIGRTYGGRKGSSKRRNRNVRCRSRRETDQYDDLSNLRAAYVVCDNPYSRSRRSRRDRGTENTDRGTRGTENSDRSRTRDSRVRSIYKRSASQDESMSSEEDEIKRDRLRRPKSNRNQMDSDEISSPRSMAIHREQNVRKNDVIEDMNDSNMEEDTRMEEDTKMEVYSPNEEAELLLNNDMITDEPEPETGKHRAGE